MTSKHPRPAPPAWSILESREACDTSVQIAAPQYPRKRENALLRVRRLAHGLAAGSHVKIANVSAPIDRLSEICGPLPHGIPPTRQIPFHVFAAELCFSAVNFRYWSTRCGEQPAGGSGAIRSVVMAAFSLTPYPIDETGGMTEPVIRQSIELAAAQLAQSQFPLAMLRAEYLLEVRDALPVVELLWRRCATDAANAQDIDILLDALPGFGADPFAKRGFLFFLLLYRIHGLCGSLARLIPLPADYQVPKVLAAAGAIVYSPSLRQAIEREEFLPPGSNYELEIRATSIVAVEALARELGTTEEIIDVWLWDARRKVAGPHHLTRTAFY